VIADVLAGLFGEGEEAFDDFGVFVGEVGCLGDVGFEVIEFHR